MRINVVQTRSEAPTDQDDPWVLQAACTSTDPETFFPEQYPGTVTERKAVASKAKTICGDCPVRRECLREVMAWEAKAVPALRHGIYGGLDFREREELARDRRAVRDLKP